MGSTCSSHVATLVFFLGCAAVGNFEGEKDSLEEALLGFDRRKTEEKIKQNITEKVNNYEGAPFMFQ